MKRSIRSIIGAAVLIGVVTLTAPLAMAQSQSTTLTNEQRSQVVANCTSIKSTITQLGISDALLRVNRGKAYESLRTRLMDTFNARIAGNNLDAQGMLSVTQNYGTTLDEFRTAYITYERQLAATLRIDCTKEPDTFHAALLDARSKRALLHEKVKTLHREIDNYKTVIGDFYQEYRRISGTDE